MTVDSKEALLHWVKTPEDDRQELNPKQEQVLTRVIQMISLLEKHRIDRDAVAIHLSLEASKGRSISQAQAYRDLATAKYIQGEVNEVHRKYERIAMANWQREIMAKAVALDDIRGFNMGMANLIKMLGLDKEDPIPVDYSKLRPVLPIFGFAPELFTHEDTPDNDEELLAELQKLRAPAKFKKTKVNEQYSDYTEID